MCCVVSVAQTVQVQVPQQVQAGENFRLSYVVSSQNVENFRMGDVPEGLEVITGPYQSRQSSYQIINGKTSSSSTITYTYTLYAAKNGTYTIPGAHATVDGKAVQSSSATSSVSGTASAGGNAQGGQSSSQSGSQRGFARQRQADQSPQEITPKDLYITVSANKRHVYEQEPVLLTYKVYTLVDLTALQGEMPELTGFHVQELPLPQQKSFSVETINGKQYRADTRSQNVAFPQSSGTMELPPITFKGTVMQRTRNIDPFEAFFNGGSAYTEVKKEIKAPGITIEVEPLPTKPATFSGGVGQFTLAAKVDHAEVKAGDPITLSVTIGGVGNMKLVKAPQLELPKDFEVYDPKVSEQTHLTARGVEGTMTYDYLIVARNQGQYTIPALEMVYFDPAAKSYKTLRTEPIELSVAKGEGKSAVVDYASIDRDSDIHDIHTRQEVTQDTTRGALGVNYWLWCVALWVLFVAMVVLARRLGIWRSRRAKDEKRRARKRLRKAAKLLREGKADAFFDETLRAMWAVAEKKELAVESRQAVDELVEACELARYGAQSNDNLQEIYEKALDTISNIDNK